MLVYQIILINIGLFFIKEKNNTLDVVYIV